MKGLRISIGCMAAALALLSSNAALRAQTLEGAFIFGSRNLMAETPNAPGTNYTMVHHADNSCDAHNALAYDMEAGYGFEVINPGATERNCGFQFGPFDDSPNNRTKFADTLPEEIYDSFIGFKDHATPCNDTEGQVGGVCDPPEGGIFRVDVPNGLYQFVGAFGDADNPHAHRVVAEDGGSGGPENIGPNHVVLVHNHDQAQFDIGEADTARPGEGVFAAVGFGDKLPPEGDGVAPDPVFVFHDQNGMPSAAADSPVLNVTQGYIRIHLLQGNSNAGPGAPEGGDPNGPDIVLLEVWRVGQATEVPAVSTVALVLLALALVGAGGFALLRHRRPATAH